MAVGLIDKIYKVKKKNDIFVLSNGHTGLALYVVLEKYHKLDAEKLFDFHGVHPNRNGYHRISVSTGSLGHGLPIAVGMALANRKRNVFVLISDGECAEGSMWEALRIATENRLENLRIMLMANGMGAYGKVDIEYLRHRILTFYPLLIVETDMYKYPDFLNGQEGHYHTLTEEEYKEVTTL
jgi:transketolase